MKYIRWPSNNLGDNLNDIIFPSLGITEKLDFRKHNFGKFGTDCVLGLGTLLNKKIIKSCTVAGSGSSGTTTPQVPLRYEFVRGPLTAGYIGIPKSKALGDTAYYLTGWMQRQSSNAIENKIGIIPHWSTPLYGDNVIRPELSIEEFIKKLSSCRAVIAEAMHGAICADMLRVPWAPIQIGVGFDHFKWHDWARSMDLNIEIGDLRRYRFYLSRDSVLDRTTDHVTSALESIIDRFVSESVVWC